MKHFSYLETVSRLANANGGQNFDNEDQADKALLADAAKFSAMAVLEFLHRFNEAGAYDRNKSRAIEKPMNAKAFPGKEVGDSVWDGDLDCGFSRYIVIAKDRDGYLLVVRCDWNPQYPPSAQFAADWHHASLAEAIATVAREDIKYHGDRLEFCRRALAAVEATADLSEFADGFDAKRDELGAPP